MTNDTERNGDCGDCGHQHAQRVPYGICFESLGEDRVCPCVRFVPSPTAVGLEPEPPVCLCRHELERHLVDGCTATDCECDGFVEPFAEDDDTPIALMPAMPAEVAA